MIKKRKSSCENPDYLKGEWLVVFDCSPINRASWKAARVVECYWLDGRRLIDVVFIDSCRISRGHCLYSASSITPYWQNKIDALLV